MLGKRNLVLAPSDAFVERTLVNRVRASKAASQGARPSATFPLETPDSQYNRVSLAPNYGQGQSSPLEERSIPSDPRELWYLALPYKLTPQQCVQILRAALGGDLWQQWQLLSLMLDTWPTFRMAQHQLREAVAYTRFNVVPYAEDGEQPTKSAMEKAGLVSRAIKAMDPDPFSDEVGFSGMVYHLLDAMLNGLTMVELIWSRDESSGVVVPRAAAWTHPRHFTFNQFGQIVLTDDSFQREWGSLTFEAKRQVKGGMNPDKFLTSQFLSRSGSVLGAGFMRPLVWYWAARQFNSEWMLNTAKQYGSPFIDITYRPGGSSDAEERAKLNEFLKNAGPERRLLHPEGTVATIHPAQTLGAENPQRYLTEEADRAALFLLLGQESTTKSIPGQLGGTDAKQDIKEERVLNLAQWSARNPLRQLARAILRQNYGNADECPEFVPDRTRPLTSLEAGGLITSTLAIPVRVDELYKKINFTPPEPGDTVIHQGRIQEMLTPEEQAQLEAEQQQAQLEGSVPLKDPKTVQARLNLLTPKQVDELEAKVTAAERKTTLNGDWAEITQMLEARR